MNIKLKRFSAVIFGAWLMGAGLTALAGTPANITEAEWALLPRYCPHTMAFKGYTPENRARWEPLMGQANFSHMHHYCWARINFRRAEDVATPAQQKRRLREEALGDFIYVVRNTDDAFVLLPEVLTWLGRTEVLLNKPANASNAFAKARALKPDYWPAYSHWAEYLLAKGLKKESMEIVKTGLQHAPEAKVLHELFRALGGKPGDMPPPIPKKEPTPPERISPEQQASDAPSPTTDGGEQKP
jgi:tetratricopeptide (TPR) repeat protein